MEDQFTRTTGLLTHGDSPAGSVGWRSPSNIALVKYWGKHGEQLPRNPSVSFTLDRAATETTLHYRPRTAADTATAIALDFYLDGIAHAGFGQRTARFLERLQRTVFPWLTQLHLSVSTTNTFPHSAGIASSASGMSALVLCLCELEQRLFPEQAADGALFWQRASYLARLGSGSACRSVYGSAAVWGTSQAVAGSSDLFAIPFGNELHPIFRDFHDDILLVSSAEKSVSSRAGHALMEGNPYAPARYAQANERLVNLLAALRTGDVAEFGSITEAEALSLHALMMTSTPAYVLMEPNSLAIIQAVQQYRADTGHPLYFTLDAGPNLHLLYPHQVAKAVQDFIHNHLLAYTAAGKYIADRVGDGPTQLSTHAAL